MSARNTGYHIDQVAKSLRYCGYSECRKTFSHDYTPTKVGFRLMHLECAPLHQSQQERLQKAREGAKESRTVLPECRNTMGYFNWTEDPFLYREEWGSLFAEREQWDPVSDDRRPKVAVRNADSAW